MGSKPTYAGCLMTVGAIAAIILIGHHYRQQSTLAVETVSERLIRVYKPESIWINGLGDEAFSIDLQDKIAAMGGKGVLLSNVQLLDIVRLKDGNHLIFSYDASIGTIVFDLHCTDDQAGFVRSKGIGSFEVVATLTRLTANNRSTSISEEDSGGDDGGTYPVERFDNHLKIIGSCIAVDKE
jgi:hypothetical protein